jgi:hypothetical protein
MKISVMVLVGAVLWGGVSFLAATPALAADPSPKPSITLADATGTDAHDATGADAAQSRNAARSRMRECGHQWSAMKKNGTAAGMTWKEFSQGCLAKQ